MPISITWNYSKRIYVLCLPIVQTTDFQSQQKFNYFTLCPFELSQEYGNFGNHYNKYNSHWKCLTLTSTCIPSNLHWKFLKISLIQLQRIAVTSASVNISSFSEKMHLLKNGKHVIFFSGYFTLTRECLRKTHILHSSLWIHGMVGENNWSNLICGGTQF